MTSIGICEKLHIKPEFLASYLLGRSLEIAHAALAEANRKPSRPSNNSASPTGMPLVASSRFDSHEEGWRW